MHRNPRHLFFLLLLVSLLAGCRSAPAPSADRILLVPGAAGNGPWYNGLRQGLCDGGAYSSCIQALRWGAPAPLYMINLQDPAIHRAAETKLAQQIIDYRQHNPHAQLAIIAHSAGCGVTLGALAQLPQGMMVQRVILLAPSVSPTYNLLPPLQHVETAMHTFHSSNDQLWLQWRTSTFGTYDNQHTPAAGNQGFSHSQPLPADRLALFHQHPYNPAWSQLGNDGGHGGALARPFAHDILAPLIMGD